MIRKVEVKGLNNRLNGAWEFNEDLNIITGRNGSGKTTLLKLIWYVISGNIEQIIYDIQFQAVSIETDSFSLFIQVESGQGELQCQFANNDSTSLDFEKPLRRAKVEEIHELGMQIASGSSNSLFFPSFRRIEGGFTRAYRHMPSDDFVRWRRRTAGDRATEVLQDAMAQFSTEISVYAHRFIASISTYDIANLLTEKYADVSEETDTLHVKLSEEITQKISERKSRESVLEDIRKQVEQTTEKRESLLRPFSVLEDRIRDVFQYEGIRVAAEITFGEAKEAIISGKLSAGEQQMLSFLCYNTFSENTTIFIDEPELSLHVDWQRRLLPTLLEQETGNQFFVATHSPFIYGKYPDKEIRLDEDRGGE